MNFITRLYEKISKDNIFMHAAALALYTAFSISPLIILLISFLSTLNFNLQNQLVAEINSLLGTQAGAALAFIISSSENHKNLAGLSGSFGILVLFISASAIFGQLQYSLNIIWESAPPSQVDETWWQGIKNYLHQRLISIGLVLSFILVTMVSLVLSSILSSMIYVTDENLKNNLNIILSFIVYASIFSAIFMRIPDQKIPWKEAVAGGLITAAMFIIGKSCISYYLGRSAVGSAYGAAGSLIAFLAWVYYSSIIIFLGAEISSLKSSNVKNQPR